MCVALASFSCRRADVTENRRFRPIGTFGDYTGVTPQNVTVTK